MKASLAGGTSITASYLEFDGAVYSKRKLSLILFDDVSFFSSRNFSVFTSLSSFENKKRKSKMKDEYCLCYKSRITHSNNMVLD